MTKSNDVSLGELRSKKRPVTRSVDIFLNSEVAEAVNRAQVVLDQIEKRVESNPGELNLQVRRDEARAELERLQEEAIVSGDVVTFTFRSIGRKAYERLIEEHPPTEAQQKDAREEGLAAGLSAQLSRLSWNADTFPPALIAAASVAPKISNEEAWELYNDSDDWNSAELTALFLAARDAQQARAVADLGKSRRESGLIPS